MSWVALEIEDDRILIAAARASGKRIQVQNLVSVDIEGSDESVADQLKKALSGLGVGRSDALVVVNRASTEVRLLDVPPAPANELPDIVRFVARNEFATLNDSWLLDFVRLSGGDNEPGQVLAAGVSPEMRQQIQSIVEAAGLRLKHIVLRPFAALDLVADQVKDDQPRLLIDPDGDSFDLTLMRGQELAATRTVRRPASQPPLSEFLVPQIRRMLTSSRRALADQPVAEVISFGDATEQADLVAAIESDLDLTTRCLDPMSLAQVSSRAKEVEDGPRFAALLGALARQNAGTRHAIDFLNPRRPVIAKRDMSKVYVWGGVAVAASLFVVALGWWTLNSQATEIEQLTTQLNDLKQRNDGNGGRESVDEVVAKVGEIDEWILNRVNWQEELLQYSDLALTPDETIVDLFDAQIGSGDEPARAIVNARTADYRTEGQLIDSLSTRFEVRPTRTGDSEDPDYPISTSLRIELPPPNATAEEKLKAINRRAADYVKQAAAERQEATQTPEEAADEDSTEAADGNGSSEVATDSADPGA